MDEDPFETVAIAYTQVQADVILSLFAWNGIPAYAKNIAHVRTDPVITLALGAMPIRVYGEFAAEARAMLAEAEANATEGLSDSLSNRITKVALGLIGLIPPPRVSAEIVG